MAYGGLFIGKSREFIMIYSSRLSNWSQALQVVRNDWMTGTPLRWEELSFGALS